MKPIEQSITVEETTKAVQKFVQKKEQAQARKLTPPQIDQPLPKVDEKYQELCNIQYVQDNEARKELF